MTLYKKYPYPILGSLLGLFAALCILFFGFFKMIFVLLCAGLGAALGYWYQKVKLLK